MESDSLTAIRTERVTDTVYQMLRERIVEQRFAPGSKINVEEIAKQLDVSRTPVHEALTILANDGLVEVRPRRGTFVTEFTSRDYEESLDIRRALEVLACETVVVHATEEDIADLRRLVEQMASSVVDASDSAEAQEHLNIIDALERRDVAALKSALDIHLRRSTASLIEDVMATEGRTSIS